MVSRQYGLILRLIGMLPRYSHTKAAMEDDPEYVEMVREAYMNQPNSDDEDDEPKGPPLHDWSGIREDLMMVVEELRLNREATVAAAGGKAKKIQPATRPETALTIMSRSVRIEKRKAAHDSLVSKLLPHRK